MAKSWKSKSIPQVKEPDQKPPTPANPVRQHHNFAAEGLGKKGA